MKTMLRTVLFIFLSALGLSLNAQVELPRPSPNASVTQDVGTTEIKVEYSSPGVKGRVIWGDLVPYDQPWRAGANAATAIAFDKDVMISGSEVKAGTYRLFITPMESGEWSIHISNGESIFAYMGDDGNFDMDALMEDDVVRIMAEPQMSQDSWERLAFTIDPGDNNVGTVSMRWENVVLSFDVEVGAVANAMASIDKTFNAWYPYASSAEYYVDNGGDAEKANRWADMALELRDDHFFAYWVKAKCALAMEDNKTAKKMAQKALEVGEEQGGGFFDSRKELIENFLADL